MHVKLLLITISLIISGCIASIAPKSLGTGKAVDVDQNAYLFASINRNHWENKNSSIALIVENLDTGEELVLGARIDTNIVETFSRGDKSSHNSKLDIIYPVAPGQYRLTGIANHGPSFLGTTDKINFVSISELNIVTPRINTGEAAYMGAYYFNLQAYNKKRDFYYIENVVDLIALKNELKDQTESLTTKHPGFESLKVKQLGQQQIDFSNDKLPRQFYYECDGRVGCGSLLTR